MEWRVRPQSCLFLGPFRGREVDTALFEQLLREKDTPLGGLVALALKMLRMLMLAVESAPAELAPEFAPIEESGGIGGDTLRRHRRIDAHGSGR